jgi:hypothetical protein
MYTISLRRLGPPVPLSPMPNWTDVLGEIQITQSDAAQKAAAAVDSVRRKYLDELFRHTDRNVIAYYSGWLQKPGQLQTSLDDEDKNGFMAAVHKLDRTKGLDLILHTPGGSLAATQSLVTYLQTMFDKDIRAIVPQLAMSAGTIISCSTKSIVMGKQSNLGPVDPQLRGIPAAGVVEEFKRAHREITSDPNKLAIWRPILEKYHPTFLAQCEYAIKYSKKYVTEQLNDVMFSGVRGKKAKVAKIVRDLTNYKAGHDRHIHVDECDNLGLKIERLEDDNVFQDLVLTVHHCFMHTLANTRAFKIIENHLGTAMVKQVPVSAV